MITADRLYLGTIAVTDVDGDGDLDVLAPGTYRTSWYENRLAGDADDDGRVEFEDFATLAHNCGRTTPADAVWEDGDFDGDGKVDFSDFTILAKHFGQTRP